MFNQIFNKRKVLVTGHNGFKGSWLSLWLNLLGAEVSGISLEPETNPNHWNSLNLKLANEFLININSYGDLDLALKKIKPEIIFHLAAQSLVKEGYKSPLKTWETNVMGTANLLECANNIDSVKAIVVVTTDKCYENKEWIWGYRETDRLGGKDPYSASKASCEFVVESYRNNFLKSKKIKYATARGGNVVGGGDWSNNRIIPDAIRSLLNKDSLLIRSPFSTRPWQHVLDCLSGYLLLAENLIVDGDSFSRAWNYGPDDESNKSVEDVIKELKKHLPKLRWDSNKNENFGESIQLHLDSNLARKKQKWEPVWDFNKTIFKTAEWYDYWINEGKINTI